MRSCDAWLNGRSVGKVVWDPLCGTAEIRCNLRDGWIYRAVLLYKEKELLQFGVLVPGKDGFTAKGILPKSAAYQNGLHCEVLRNLPGEIYVEGKWLTKSQIQPWEACVFPLEPPISRLIDNQSESYYRIYNHNRYILIPIRTGREDPLIELYCTGKPVFLEDRWYLCIRIDSSGKIIPWTKDEN